MSIAVKCPNPQCGKSFSLKNELAGKRVKCSSCGGGIAVPMSAWLPVEDPAAPVVAAVPAAASKRSRLPWVVAGVGCLSLLAIIGVGLVILTIATVGRGSWSSDSGNDADMSRGSSGFARLKERLGVSKAGLDDEWAALSEAMSRPYYRGHLPSDFDRQFAIAALADVERDGDSDQRGAARKATELLGERAVAEARRARANINTHDERLRIDRFKVKALLDPDNVDKLYQDYFEDAAGRLNRAAQARQDAADRQYELQGLWLKSVAPAMREAAGPESAAPLLELRTEQLSKEVWFAARNVSGRALTNVTLTVQFSQKKFDGGMFGPVDWMWFAREWPAGETIHPRPVMTWTIIEPRDDALRRYDGNVAEFEVWCDQGRTARRAPTRAEPWAVRDPFMFGMVQAGTRYFNKRPGNRSWLEFTSFRKTAGGCEVNAVMRTEFANRPGQPQLINYVGTWTENRKDFRSIRPFALRMNLVPTSKEWATMEFEWSEGEAAMNGVLSRSPFVPIPAGG